MKIFGIDQALQSLPDDCRFNVGHTPHWYRRDAIPKFLKRKPYEAYVVRGEIGTKTWVFESADGATPAEALISAIHQAMASIAAKAEQSSV